MQRHLGRPLIGKLLADKFPARPSKMLLETILHRVQPCKSFCYESARFADGGKRILVNMRARKNGRPICSGCLRKCPGYDRLKPRRYEFVAVWNIPVFLCYT